MNSTGTMVIALISGNITRAPNRSVSAPTGMRPSEPTSTGTATRSDFSTALSRSVSVKNAPSGLTRAQAQKLTAKPTVATASMTHAWRLTSSPAGRAAALGAEGSLEVIIVRLASGLPTVRHLRSTGGHGADPGAARPGRRDEGPELV